MMTPIDKTMLSSILRVWDTMPDWHTIITYIFAGWVLAPIVQFVERFLWSDWEFIGFLSVILILDAITASVVEFKKGNLTSMFLQDVLLKFFAYGVILVTFHVIGNHTVNGNPNSILASVLPFLDATVYAAIMIKEAISINENLATLGYSLIPKFILRKMKAFQEKGIDAIEPVESKENEPKA